MLPFRLPSVSLLNGSAVTDSEREDAERFFIRYYFDYPEKELPYRYVAVFIYYAIELFFNICIYLCILYKYVCDVKILTPRLALIPPQIPFPGDQVWEAGTTCRD